MTRARALDLVRAGFVLVALGCAAWGFHGRWGEIADAAGRVGPGRLVAGWLLATAGLCLTAVLWRHCLRWAGSELAVPAAARVFFVGQLGKYIPGSIWNFAAQAQLGRPLGVPARASLTASGVFLLVHTLTGAAAGAALVAAGPLDAPGPRWVWALSAAAALAALAVLAAGSRGRLAVRGRDLAGAVGLMGLVWTAYGAALLALLPTLGPTDLPLAVGVFALGHVAGVIVVFAPAGLGAREATMIALLAPAVGFGAATAAALLVRIVHTVADLVLAAASWSASNRGQNGQIS
ncbi:lysylphosphatidylglycerol synthase domain-containing protein [Nocardioides nitrophenolicus]|uniref:lysylphosphatidylglycerol synthase domain-containing protein n=1 Tax=Nocardioides nitrophenolicus TaxID=60489 RepID=UPI0019566555|nr:lysylphosphatidylglycerol synthase domain-containing protein [Nocardioides nitrophenolicus]MBM7515403.1 uncharacterized membrane protein YbhN (UPF0104 family) [Nocardioides nitrophenolicus]